MEFTQQEQWAIWDRLPISDNRRAQILQKVLGEQAIINQNGHEEKEEGAERAGENASQAKEMGDEKTGENDGKNS